MPTLDHDRNIAPDPATATADRYVPARPGRSEFVRLRGLDYHLQCWGDASLVTPERPPIVMMHGWMDVGASFQFLVDELARSSPRTVDTVQHPQRFIVAPDWRGFGLTGRQAAPVDTYWFPDYLADLDALLNAVDAMVSPTAAQGGSPDGSLEPSPKARIDLLGHSMGGNVAMIYAGVRPERVRKLVNLEGFGMPDSKPDEAPGRYRRWLDELAAPASLHDYDSLDAVARRLQRNNPLLPPDRATWLAQHWATEAVPGRWALLADPAHKHTNPILYRKEEVLAAWRKIEAPMLWIQGDLTDTRKFWGNKYPSSEFDERLSQVRDVRRHVVAPAGHMLHHDQPAQVARLLEAFLDGA